jgi:gliding motility-associated-like protein
MKRYYHVCLLLLLVATTSKSQTVSSCTNSDFELNNFSNWTGMIGNCCPVNTTTNGIVNGRHTIVSGPGFDPRSQGLIPLVAPGGQYSARLGNSNVGAQAERLSYSFLVTPDQALFIYRYAVILEDPGHSSSQQPRFSIRVFDQNNDPVNCGSYDVVASGTIPGFISIGDLRIKPWTTVGIELSAYVGQQITIEFTTADCGVGGHFGYAYIDCFCSPFTISSDLCPGENTISLHAPVGFASYLWSNGDTLPDVTLINPVLGSTYSVTMTSVTGCQVTLNTTIMPTNLNANFYEVIACMNEARFIDSSFVLTGTPIQQWHWEFGDGNTSSDQHPVHIYSAPGNYSVRLIVFNSNCSDTLERNIYIWPAPVVDFSFVPGCIDDNSYFNSTSSIISGTLQQFIWDFGDTTSNVFTSNAQHVFTTPGPFEVTLYVESDHGCRDSMQKILLPRIEPAANVSYQSNCETTEVIFSTLFDISCGPVFSVVWNFNDGSLPDTTVSPMHTFPQPGAYPVTITMYSWNGVATVQNMDVIVPDLPVVDFESHSACDQSPAVFLDQSEVSTGYILQREWRFGDGTIQNGYAASWHTYAAPGLYDVQLIVTSDLNCVDSITRQVSIWELPVSDFSVSINTGCEPLAVDFTPTSTSASGNITTYEWDFGNGVVSTEQNPMTTFTAGTYPVQLISTSSYGCRDTLIRQNEITAFPLPAPDFTYTLQPGTAIMPDVQFLDRSENSVSRHWNFGDGNISEDENPKHKFPGKGVYYTELRTVSADGCSAVTIKPVEILEEFAIWFPNAFTPNGDGINDFYGVTGVAVSELEFYICNRWGEILFTGTKSNPVWDGYDNKGQMQEGIYTWFAKVKDIYGNTHSRNGTLALIR